MLRPLVYLLGVLFFIFGLLTGVSTVIGRATDTTIGAALISSTDTRGFPLQSRQIALFDLKRFLRTDHSLPLEHIDFTAFDHSVTAPDKVMVLTFGTQTSSTTGLYLYNFFSGSLITVFESEVVVSVNASGATLPNFFPILSPDARKVAFLHPQDNKPYLFDIETAQVSTLAFSAVNEISGLPDFIRWDWSPDSTKIAVQGAKTLYIIEIDDPNMNLEPIEISGEANDIYPVWSADSRYILFQRSRGNSQTQNFPVKIMDVSDGSEQPFTRNLQASSTWWQGCENRWLTYTVVTAEVREGYILDMHDGTTVRLNDVPILTEESIEEILPAPDCQHFIISGELMGEPGNRSRMERNARNTYIFDIETNAIEFVDETAAIFQLMENELYYLTPDVDNELWQVFKRSIHTLSEPILVTQYPPLIAAYFEWAPDMSFATYLETTPSQAFFGGKLMRLDAATGQSSPLTSEDEVAQSYVQYSAFELHNRE